MVKMTVEYQGSLRTQISHHPSSSSLTTDAPVDNMGKGEAFSPTDLLAGSLGACMVTIMGIKADSLGINIDGTGVSVKKHMSTDLPRRVGEIDINIDIPHKLSDKELLSIKNSAVNCPVAKSIHPDLIVNFNISCE